MIKEIKDYCEETKYAIDFFRKNLMSSQSLELILSKFQEKLKEDKAQKRIKKIESKQ
jgi:hypothetical protein